MKKIMSLSLLSVCALVISCGGGSSSSQLDGTIYGSGVFKAEADVDASFKLKEAPHCPATGQVFDARIKEGSTFVTRLLDTDVDGEKTGRTVTKKVISMTNRKLKIRSSDSDYVGRQYEDSEVYTLGSRDNKKIMVGRGNGYYNNGQSAASFVAGCTIKTVYQKQETTSVPVLADDGKGVDCETAANPQECKVAKEAAAAAIAKMKVTTTTTSTVASNAAVTKFIKGKYTLTFTGIPVEALLKETRQTGEIMCNGESEGFGEIVTTFIQTTEIPNLEQQCTTSVFSQVIMKPTTTSFSGESKSELISYTR